MTISAILYNYGYLGNYPGAAHPTRIFASFEFLGNLTSDNLAPSLHYLSSSQASDPIPRKPTNMALVIAKWIADAVNATDVAEYEIECDDDSAIFGDVVPCVSGTVVS